MQLEQSTPILLTGSAGFIGKNLAERLRATGWQNLLLFDKETKPEALEEYAARAGFVYHLAGVNRPQNAEEFYTGNADLTARLLAALETAGNNCPVMLSSSAQAGNGSDYGTSKLEAERKVHIHSEETGSKAFVYRFPGVFGKFSRPAYNSVVATFCHNIARGQAVEIRDPAFELPLVYIDDVVDSLVSLLDDAATPPPSGHFVEVSPVHTVSLGGLAEMLQSFKNSRSDLSVPDMSDAFTQKLYATYLSYLPENEFAYPLKANVDERGSFTEFLRTANRGQVSVNVAKPGIVKGNHWHDTKNEKFWVVSGRGVIRFRKLGSEEVISYEVSGGDNLVLDIPTGYTHNIENVGDTDLVTVMWASEPFNPEKPDTYFEKV